MRLRRNALLGLASPFDGAQDDRLCYSVEIVLTKSEHLRLKSVIDIARIRAVYFQIGIEVGGVVLEKIRLETGVKDVDGIQVLEVAGEIDVYTAPQFKDAVNNIMATGQKHLIINMSNISYMDSSGFGTLLSATKRLRPAGGTVNLVGCNRSIERILQITRLNTIFATHENVNDAIKATKES